MDRRVVTFLTNYWIAGIGIIKPNLTSDTGHADGVIGDKTPAQLRTYSSE